MESNNKVNEKEIKCCHYSFRIFKILQYSNLCLIIVIIATRIIVLTQNRLASTEADFSAEIFRVCHNRPRMPQSNLGPPSVIHNPGVLSNLFFRRTRRFPGREPSRVSKMAARSRFDLPWLLSSLDKSGVKNGLAVIGKLIVALSFNSLSLSSPKESTILRVTCDCYWAPFSQVFSGRPKCPCVLCLTF